MNFCIYCGYHLKQTSQFCPSCGNQLGDVPVELPPLFRQSQSSKPSLQAELNTQKEAVKSKTAQITLLTEQIGLLKQSHTTEMAIKAEQIQQLTEKLAVLTLQNEQYQAELQAVRQNQDQSVDTSEQVTALTEKAQQLEQQKAEQLEQIQSLNEQLTLLKDHQLLQPTQPDHSDLAKKIKVLTDQLTEMAHVNQFQARKIKALTASNVKNTLAQPARNSQTTDKETEVAPDTTVQKSSDARGISSDMRIYLGDYQFDQQTKKVYWEYGSPSLPNRHMLVTGKSGQGKTYFMQTMLFELSRKKISSLVIDYTDSYLPDALDPAFKERMQGKLNQLIVYTSKLPLNPFKLQKRTVAGMNLDEKPTDMADRVAEVFDYIFGLGVQQRSLLRKTILDGYRTTRSHYTLTDLKMQLQGQGSKAETLYGRISSLLDRDPFTYEEQFDWSQYFTHQGTVTIIQMVQFQRSVQNAMTEFLLWDLFYYSRANHDDLIYPVFLDEVQNLNFGPDAPTVKILREGRKFGWSGIFATQSLSSVKGERDAIYNCAEQIHFLPTDDQAATIAGLIDNTQSTSAVKMHLKNLHKGQCYVSGWLYNPRIGRLAKTNRIVKIDSFENR